MSNRGLKSIGINKIIPAQIDFTQVVSGSAAGEGSIIALSSTGTPVLINPLMFLDAGSNAQYSGGGGHGVFTRFVSTDANYTTSDFNKKNVILIEKQGGVSDADSGQMQKVTIEHLAYGMADGSTITATNGVLSTTGDITGVTAGNGLTGGGDTGAVTLTVGAGTGIDVAADEISVDVSDFMTNGSNNRVVTATGADAQNAEANLTFDGSTLHVNGNMGVGTSTPGARLHVFEDLAAPDDLGDWDNYQVVVRGGSDTGKTAGILLTTTNDTYGGSAIVHYDKSAFGQGDLAFYTKQSTTAVPPVEVMRLTDSGEVIKPLQPAFLAMATATSNLPTGTTKIPFESESYDVGSDFDLSTETFTAPVDGKYFFYFNIYFLAIDTAASYYYIDLETTSQNYRLWVIDPNFSSDVNYYNANGHVVVAMDEGDTAHLDFVQSGGSAQTDIATTGAGSFFGGYLL